MTLKYFTILKQEQTVHRSEVTDRKEVNKTENREKNMIINHQAN